jgi:hypothetical protein
MISVKVMNPLPSSGFMPVRNMWWPYTTADSTVTMIMAHTVPWYQYAGLRANMGMMSEMIPQAGRMKM